MSETKLGHMEFGWGAAKIHEQAPMLLADDAAHFQQDADAIIRLHLRGVLSDAERNRGITRLHKSIVRAATMSFGKATK